jgi:hypothetical protein
MVNERGTLDGQVKILRPHPNFRIFLAMDPRNGEISRAMRNRGIEVCLLDPPVMSRDTMLLLGAAGIPGRELPEAMATFHSSLVDKLRATEQCPTMRELLDWARFTSEVSSVRGRDFLYTRSRLSLGTSTRRIAPRDPEGEPGRGVHPG